MSEPKIKIAFYGGVGSVTGANFLLESPEGNRIIVDCGLIQGEKVAEEKNREPFAYDISSVRALVVTHSHLDHVGRIPKLVRDGYVGPIYSTPETKALAELILNDAVRILAEEARGDGKEPIYGQDDVDAVFRLWKTIDYHQHFNLTSDISVFLKDAGHILGSAMIEATIAETKILFTGDLGNSPAPLLRSTEEIGEADYLIMESVYGDRNHEGRAERVNKFRKIITDAVGRGGTLVIPTFSIDRTQTLLYELNNLVEKGDIPDIPVFVDSPLAIRATDVYRSGKHLFNDSVRGQIDNGDDIFEFSKLKYTISNSESRDIEKTDGAKIILAGSGMSVGGRIISHEAKYLPDPKNTVILVGYQAVGSLGRMLSDGARKVRIHSQTVKVRARIETLLGYSAHRDSDHLVEFVSTGTQRLKKVFVVMGEPKASMHLSQRINDELGIKAVVPESQAVYEL